MINVAKMIAQVRTERKVSQKQLAEMIGVTEQTVSNYEKGRRSPDFEKLEAIADALNCPVEFFVNADDKERELKVLKDGVNLPPEITPVSKIKPHYVPVIGSVAAGRPMFAERNYDSCIDAPRKADFALNVNGDSMSPNILDGDVVYIRQQDDVEDGEIGVVIIDDTVVLKHIHHVPGGLMLISDNPSYKNMIIKADEHEYVRILGKACGLTRMW